MYEELHGRLLGRCQAKAPGHGYRFKAKLFSVDSTTIDLCLSAFPWAKVTVTTVLIERPIVTGISFTSDPNDDHRPGDDATYAIGDTITAEVTFDEAVDVTGNPLLNLRIGSQTRGTRCGSGTNTTVMTCAYKVKENGSAPSAPA